MFELLFGAISDVAFDFVIILFAGFFIFKYFNETGQEINELRKQEKHAKILSKISHDVLINHENDFNPTNTSFKKRA